MKPKYNSILILFLLILLGSIIAGEPCLAQSDANNPETPTLIQQDKKTVVNAASWGFNAKDSTNAFQSAIDSGADKIIVPYMGSDWIVRPIKLRSNQEIVFEPGVIVTAKKGEFKNIRSYLILARAVENVKLVGYGATLRMQKKDYMNSSKYKKSQWRTVLGIYGCNNLKVYGLTIRDSGGDGITIASRDAAKVSYLFPSNNIVIKDCIFDNNYRQGISITSVENLLIENCILKNTDGTWPKSGIDLEPDNYNDRLSNIVINNCVSEDNKGPGFQVYLSHLSSKSKFVSILFVNCYVRRCSFGLKVGAVKDDGPEGLVEFKNCTIEDTSVAGLNVLGKSKDNVKFKFSNCKWKNTGKMGHPFSYPILMTTEKQRFTNKMGGVEFIDCYVYDRKKRPFIKFVPFEASDTISDITGDISVINIYGASMELGGNNRNINLKVIPFKSENEIFQ